MNANAHTHQDRAPSAGLDARVPAHAKAILLDQAKHSKETALVAERTIKEAHRSTVERLPAILKKLEGVTPAERIEVFRNEVEATDGTFNLDPIPDVRVMYEISLCGISAMSSSPEAAAQRWIDHASLTVLASGAEVAA